MARLCRPAKARAQPGGPGRGRASFEARSCGSASRVSPRPISVTPAQGSSGRQSRVDGSSVPRPSHTNAGGLNAARWRRTRGAARATAPATCSARAGRSPGKGRREQTRRGDASQDAEPDRLVRRAANSVAPLTSAAATYDRQPAKKARQRGPSRWAIARETPTSPRNAHATMCEWSVLFNGSKAGSTARKPGNRRGPRSGR